MDVLPFTDGSMRSLSSVQAANPSPLGSSHSELRPAGRGKPRIPSPRVLRLPAPDGSSSGPTLHCPPACPKTNLRPCTYPPLTLVLSLLGRHPRPTQPDSSPGLGLPDLSWSLRFPGALPSLAPLPPSLARPTTQVHPSSRSRPSRTLRPGAFLVLHPVPRPHPRPLLPRPSTPRGPPPPGRGSGGCADFAACSASPRAEAPPRAARSRR